ncbi:MAG: hypothetical protein JWP97_5990 [Labilithrix sp.]|nr:hypothetical protein [Labilithrix sp.]
MIEHEEQERVAAPAGAAPAEADWGWPAFAARFPEHEGLLALTLAFSRGDYRTVRDGTARLIADDTTPKDVAAAARLLRTRTEPDPTARVFFVLAGALLAFLSIYWLTHDGPEHTAPPAPAAYPQVEHVK